MPILDAVKRSLLLSCFFKEIFEKVPSFYYDISKGLTKGSPLSPYLGALYLSELDQTFKGKNQIFYTRYMDDFVALFKKRSALGAYVKKMYAVLDDLKLKIAYPKTYIGKSAKGFSFLGYFLKPDKRLQVAKKTLKTCANRISQLYEQGASMSRFGKYVRHFTAWARGGFSARLQDKFLRMPNRVEPSTVIGGVNNSTRVSVNGKSDPTYFTLFSTSRHEFGACKNVIHDDFGIIGGQRYSA